MYAQAVSGIMIARNSVNIHIYMFTFIKTLGTADTGNLGKVGYC